MSFYDGLTLGSEYTKDIMSWLKVKERNNIHYIRKQSPQLEKRSQLVDWTAEVAEKLGLHQSSLHLAVRLIDLFMDGHDIQVSCISDEHACVSNSFCLSRTHSCIWFAWARYYLLLK